MGFFDKAKAAAAEARAQPSGALHQLGVHIEYIAWIRLAAWRTLHQKRYLPVCPLMSITYEGAPGFW